MITIGLGANLPYQDQPAWQTLVQAVAVLRETGGLTVLTVSPFYCTAPVPPDPDAPDYINAVARIETDLSAHDLMHCLLAIEQQFGRIRSVRNAPRTLDLDLLDYHGQQVDDDLLTLPHPRLQDRAFVLYPLADVAPQWKHPVTGETITVLIDALSSQEIAQMDTTAEAI